jgi:hypothetical protein
MDRTSVQIPPREMAAGYAALAPRGRPADIPALYDYQRRRDTLGHTLHTALAATTCLTLAAPTTIAQFGLVPVFFCTLIRAVGIHPFLGVFARSLMAKLLMLWAAWLALSLLWTPDLAQGIDELSDLRWALLPVCLWPVLDRRPLLVRAIAAGFLCALVVQGIHAAWPSLEIPGIRWPHDPDRNAGWWKPVVGGSMLTAALGLGLPAAVFGRGRERLAGLVFSALVAAGVLATGTRGAWLASATLVAIILAGALARALLRRREDGTRAWRPALIALTILAIAVAAAWLTVGPAIQRRFDRGVTEVRAAIHDRDFTSDTGARILMAWWAMEAVADHPLRGTGAGGYAAWVRAHLVEQGIDPASRHIHAHAHNAALHTAATLGLVGLAIAGSLVFIVLRAEWRRLPDTLAGLRPASDAAPACALLGLLLVSAFDSIHVNTQTSAMLFALLGLCHPSRPEPAHATQPDPTAGRTG